MNEKVLIICESIYHGNTHKLAVAMARKLNCRLITCEQAISENIQQYKIIGLGSGIYFTSHHPKLFNIVSRMENMQKAFLFSTHGRPFLGKYHESLKLALSKQGVTIIGEFSCRGYDCTGPYIIVGGGNKGKPNEKDQKKVAKFVARLLPEYSKNTDVVQNGNNIEIHYDECIGCGKCKTICPMKVFDIKNKKPIVINENDCIHCSLCKEQCPSQAIVIQHSWKEAIAIAKRHSKKNSL
ncbi:4Fe-4S binding protein [Haloimpatiens sp. FM7315]|uniref:4Fe-4S binding protein n=1 Tax=Haloimpatiens sp. FM7315 TaxID=3298609 RepID=UPI003977830D